MTGQAIICKLPELQPIEGADRIKQATIFGETIIVSVDHQEGELGLLFDCETQLSHEFASNNNLYRHPELNVDKTKTGYFDDNRRVRPIRLKGVKVSAFWMPMSSVSFIVGAGGVIPFEGEIVGTQLDEINGVNICEKFVTTQTKQAQGRRKEGRVSKKDLVPTFKEHFDTDHWERGKHLVQEGDLVTITEKLHGTSFRCGNLETIQPRTWLQRLLRLPQVKDYKFVVGSRRTIKSIEGEEVNTNSFYDQDLWTEICEREFKGKLEEGETIYGEIVGYQPNSQPIMGTHNNSKLKKFMSKEEYSEFIKKYGETTVFSYGCTQPEFDGSGYRSYGKGNKVFIYRITRTLPNGESIDLTWDQVKMRSEQLGVSHVPELMIGIETKDSSGKWEIGELYDLVNQLLNEDSQHFPMHLKEGICIRIDNGSFTPKILKHKAYNFKVLEGIIKDTDQVDIEEAN